MNDAADELLIDIRASTSGFASDIATMRNQIDTSLIGGFSDAGSVLENSLLGAIRKGKLGFDDLRRAALQSLDQIAQQALQLGLDKVFGNAGSESGLGGLLGSSIIGLLGLPGRATGGPVSPGRGYVVGERGPELFIPTSSGTVTPNLPSASNSRDVRVAIQVSNPRGSIAPIALERSGRQLASAVRRALL